MSEAAHNRIAQLEAELAALRAEMQDFSYTVSHDLRASLRHILSYAELVQEDAGPLLPDETKGFLNTISDSARHMGVQMDGLMELSRLGMVELQLAALPLQPLVQELVAECQPPAGAPIAWTIATDLPAVRGDAALLRSTLRALLDNAVKFTARKELRQIAVTMLQEDPAGATVTLQVQDNGAGFNPALQAKLFHAFARLHTIKQFPGIGMGLALCRKRMERMGGQVQAEGSPDAGCTVRITLPRA